MLMRQPRSAGHDDAPSEYARLEAQVALTDRGGAPHAGPALSDPLVLVAASDPDLRERATQQFAALGAGAPPAFRLESVATAEALVESLEREGVAVVVCGRLTLSTEGTARLDRPPDTRGRMLPPLPPDDAGPSRTLRVVEALRFLLSGVFV